MNVALIADVVRIAHMMLYPDIAMAFHHRHPEGFAGGVIVETIPDLREDAQPLWGIAISHGNTRPPSRAGLCSYAPPSALD
jgi:hypothetical protein